MGVAKGVELGSVLELGHVVRVSVGVRANRFSHSIPRGWGGGLPQFSKGWPTKVKGWPRGVACRPPQSPPPPHRSQIFFTPKMKLNY